MDSLYIHLPSLYLSCKSIYNWPERPTRQVRPKLPSFIHRGLAFLVVKLPLSSKHAVSFYRGLRAAAARFLTWFTKKSSVLAAARSQHEAVSVQSAPSEQHLTNSKFLGACMECTSACFRPLVCKCDAKLRVVIDQNNLASASILW